MTKETARAKFRRCYHSDERVQWVARLPCRACGRQPMPPHTVSVNAHTVNGGLSRKADYDTILPLCERCHTQVQHQHGWSALGDPFLYREARLAMAAEVEQRWLAYQAGLAMPRVAW